MFSPVAPVAAMWLRSAPAITAPTTATPRFHQDLPARRVEERLSEAANGNSEQYEDNERHGTLPVSRESGDGIYLDSVALSGGSVGASPYACGRARQGFRSPELLRLCPRRSAHAHLSALSRPGCAHISAGGACSGSIGVRRRTEPATDLE